MPIYTDMSLEKVKEWIDFFRFYCKSVNGDMSIWEAAYLLQSFMELAQVYCTVNLNKERFKDEWKGSVTGKVSYASDYVKTLGVEGYNFGTYLVRYANDIRHKAFNYNSNVKDGINTIRKYSVAVEALVQDIYNKEDSNLILGTFKCAYNLYGSEGKVLSIKDCYNVTYDLLKIEGYRSKYSIGEVISILRKEGYKWKDICRSICKVLGKEKRYDNSVIKDEYR